MLTTIIVACLSGGFAAWQPPNLPQTTLLAPSDQPGVPLSPESAKTLSEYQPHANRGISSTWMSWRRTKATQIYACICNLPGISKQNVPAATGCSHPGSANRAPSVNMQQDAAAAATPSPKVCPGAHRQLLCSRLCELLLLLLLPPQLLSSSLSVAPNLQTHARQINQACKGRRHRTATVVSPVVGNNKAEQPKRQPELMWDWERSQAAPMQLFTSAGNGQHHPWRLPGAGRRTDDGEMHEPMP